MGVKSAPAKENTIYRCHMSVIATKMLREPYRLQKIKKDYQFESNKLEHYSLVRNFSFLLRHKSNNSDNSNTCRN